jgi:hypothetical protein
MTNQSATVAMKTSSSGPAELELRVSAHTAWTTFDPSSVEAAILE